ncbi:nuclear transport factor 2 family protein [Epibacterium ulvae]|uniref:YybH family protein n=1 Tax=Epibacterium ulvae TaxID=1156985 RepID=UPI001BFC6DD7|nr:DUF4440 domain-containing protein [Epibacterium ulvae]MBT8154670.1 nuclear transport factor 2 family protein [Epibacterium ulvae]
MRLLSSLKGFALATLIATTVLAADDIRMAEFEAYNDRYNEIIANYDLEAFMNLYNDSPLWIEPDKAPIAGLEVPGGTFGFIVQNEGALTHTFDELKISDDGSQAVMIGTYALDIEKVGAKAEGTYLFVLERNGDSWDIVVDMFNQHAAE